VVKTGLETTAEFVEVPVKAPRRIGMGRIDRFNFDICGRRGAGGYGVRS